MSSGSLLLFTLVLCVAAYMGLGYLWYSPLLFLKPWMKLSGAERLAKMNKRMAFCLSLSFLTGIISAIVLAMVIIGMNYPDAFLVAFVIWFTFTGLPMAVNTAYAGKKFKLWAIEAGFPLVASLLMTVIIIGMYS